jgi:hypothetical protein
VRFHVDVVDPLVRLVKVRFHVDVVDPLVRL